MYIYIYISIYKCGVYIRICTVGNLDIVGMVKKHNK